MTGKSCGKVVDPKAEAEFQRRAAKFNTECPGIGERSQPAKFQACKAEKTWLIACTADGEPAQPARRSERNHSLLRHLQHFLFLIGVGYTVEEHRMKARLIVDGLPGVELAGTVNTHVATVNTDVTAGSRTRFVCAYVIVDQRRNLAYIVAYHLDAPASGTIGLG